MKNFWHTSFLVVGLTLSSTYIILQGDCMPVSNHSREVNLIYGELFEGDIILPEGPAPRNGIIGRSYRWPNKTVPYVLSHEFNKSEAALIRGVLTEISYKTCIKFLERAAADRGDHVFIDRNNSQYPGCNSAVGRQGGRQILNLQAQVKDETHCLWKGVIAHEVMHAIGFYHEQSRADRDDYVTIIWDNIPPEKHFAFEKYNRSYVDPHGVTYDYASVMHYDRFAFAIDPTKPTIVPKIYAEIGNNQAMSEGDIKKIRVMYNCT